MSSKTLVFVCSQFLFIQTILGQCIGAPWTAAPCSSPCGAPLAAAWSRGGPYAEWAYAPAASLAASNGPGLAVSSASPLIPAGVSVLSENVYEGALASSGAVPFLGSVAVEGALPTAGAGAIAYGCGNGAVGITAEDSGYGFAGPYGAGIAGAYSYGAGLAGPLGYGPAGLGYGPGCGCGAIY